MEARGMHSVGKLLTYILTLRSYNILQAPGASPRNHVDGRTTPIVQNLGLQFITHRMDSRADWTIGRKDIGWQNVSASITTATKEKKSNKATRLASRSKKIEHSKPLRQNCAPEQARSPQDENS
jgi:hypothetical protein